MPTGYTAGILDGTITTFPQFAKVCMKAFGAVIHMRDEPLSEPYRKCTPSDYYDKELVKAEKLKKEIESLSDEEIVSERRAENQESIEYHKSKIIEAEENEIKLNKILDEVIKFNPPTKDHENFKNFMIDQIKKTIDCDCKTDYHKKELERLNNKTYDSKIIRAELTKRNDSDIAYYNEKKAEEIKKVEESNKWVEDVLKVINDETKN